MVAKLLISPEYQKLNRQLHVKFPTYGMSGYRWANKVLRLAREYNCKEILDYGCGKGSLRIALHTMKVEGIPGIIEYDPAISSIADPKLDPVDFVVCLDVLEHVEPDCILNVLDHLAFLTRKVLFATVATRPAKKNLLDGRNAHLIVEDWEWWEPLFSKRFKVIHIASNISQEGEFCITAIPIR